MTKNFQRRRFLKLGVFAILENATFFGVASRRREKNAFAAPSDGENGDVFSAIFDFSAKSGDADAAPLSARPLANDRLAANALRPGDVLAARWADERKNSTPGYWNHLGIVDIIDKTAPRVVEAQRVADGIVATPIRDFCRRYSEIVVVRYFCSKTAIAAARYAGERVALRTVATPPRWEIEQNAQNNGAFGGLRDALQRFENAPPTVESTQTGPKYSQSASIWRRIDEVSPVENCVSLVRRAFLAASGVDYRWRTPDSLAEKDESGDFRRVGFLKTRFDVK